MNPIWPLLAVGAVVLLIGVLLIGFRRKVQTFVARFQRETLGSVGDKIASTTPAGSIGAVGVFAIIFGLILLLVGFFYHPHH